MSLFDNKDKKAGSEGAMRLEFLIQGITPEGSLGYPGRGD